MDANLKQVKNIAKKAYKKVPKKKLVNKAATFGAKQLIGSTYLDIVSFFYKKTKKKAISYAGTYAYDSFLRSKFARDKLNTLPMSIISMIIRTIANFLLFSKLITGFRLFDFVVSMVVTVIITLMAPFFYTSIKAHEDMFLLYTNEFVDRFMGTGGWEYVEDIKNKLLLGLGFILLIVLQFVEINSRYVQELIIHTIITGIISDKLQRWIDSARGVKQLHYGMLNTECDMYVLIPGNYVELLYKRANVCDTSNRVIMNLKPQRAKVINISDMINKSEISNDNKNNSDINMSKVSMSNMNKISKVNSYGKFLLDGELDIVSDYDPSLHSNKIEELT